MVVRCLEVKTAWSGVLGIIEEWNKGTKEQSTESPIDCFGDGLLLCAESESPTPALASFHGERVI